MRKGKINREYFVYRYIMPDETVVYVGKTDASLKQRINAHAKEAKFLPYLEWCKVEFVELSNYVETDIVEKYLINLWKPVLNEKDNVCGRTAIGFQIPDWVPYEAYEASKKQTNSAYKTALKVAMQNEELLDALLSMKKDESIFLTNTLHPTGMLGLFGKPVRMTKRDVACVGGYKQRVTLNGWKLLSNLPNTLRVEIWRPVSEFFLLPRAEKERLDTLHQFLQRMRNFKENGYQEGEFGEPFEIEISQDTYDVVCPYFAEFFLNPKKFDNEYTTEIDTECFYNGVFEKTCEEIAKEELCFYSANDVIPREDQEPEESFDFLKDI